VRVTSRQGFVAAAPAVVDEIRSVAEKHQGDAEGYGETAWNEETKTVLYVAGDWTDPEPIEADFLAIDGVENFDAEAEGLPTGWWDATVVYPDDPSPWVLEPPEGAALAEIVAFAQKPLVYEVPVEDDVDRDGIPDSVHYRLAEACVTCFYYSAQGDGGYCRMFEAEVEPEYICDEWTTQPPEDA
jgi:hypothetical protein